MTREPRRPNLFILGAPRCGTTAMFELLGEHPEIHPSAVKEPHYFVPGNIRTLDEYLALFAGATDERWLLEASPHYLVAPAAPRLIREFSPDSRVMVMVRDPVELLHSLHDLRAQIQREPDSFPTALEREDAEHRYWRIARLGEQLDRVYGVFPRERVHVVVHDDFAADNARAYRAALEFLGVDPTYAPPFRTVNSSGGTRFAWLQRELWREDGVLKAVTRRVLPGSARHGTWRALNRLNRRNRPRRALEPELARTIWLRLEADVRLLSELLDRDLVSLWRR